MKLIKSDPANIWIIVNCVTDDDAEVLSACGFQYGYSVDENGYNGEDDGFYPHEIWYNINK